MRIFLGITIMMLLFTQQVHLTVWIYELAVWTSLLTVHIVRGESSDNHTIIKAHLLVNVATISAKSSGDRCVFC